MTISIDTNIIVGLWREDEASNRAAANLLDEALRREPLVVCGPVVAELMADSRKNIKGILDFLRDVRIGVEWEMGEEDWHEAGRAYRGYAQRRWASSKSEPRRILADFLIGAHALCRAYTLLTIDDGHYRAAFPKLKIISAL